jgi:hypothetical protein
MHTVIVTVAPIATRSGYYTARCNGRLLCRSRQPFLDSARELLATGYPADTIIVMRHAGSAVEALRSTIGAAARLTVETSEQGTPVFRQWRGPRTRGAGPSIAPCEGAATSLWMEAADALAAAIPAPPAAETYDQQVDRRGRPRARS